MGNEALTAIEFFSGIGAFAEACRGTDLQVVAAFDMNLIANQAYEANFKLKPSAKNLDTLKKDQLPEADMWWMSPPCTPFTRRGKQLDDQDPRARALLNLIDLIPECLPDRIFMENVEGFIGSQTSKKLERTLEESGYRFKSLQLCSSDFGVPMRRPRYFLSASRIDVPAEPAVVKKDTRKLEDYLIAKNDDDTALMLDNKQVERYRTVLNIVSPDDENAYLICFTRGYYQCRKASGSLIQLPDDRVRFVSPAEILRLFGFSEAYQFPNNLSLVECWRLVGNSVDVRSVRAVLSTAGL